jgi:ankyrin repeat protein
MRNIFHFSPPFFPQHIPQPQPALQQQLNNAIVYSNEYEMGMLVDRALSAGARFNIRGEYATHPMVLAVRANKPCAIAVLMGRGVTLPDVPQEGTDLLMEACNAGHDEMSRVLLSVAGMEVEETNALGLMPLHFAIISGAPGTVQVILETDANVNAVIKAGSLDEYLDTFQEDQNFLPDDRVTPLMLAAALGNDAIVQQLLRAGADANLGIRSPLVIAVRKGHAATVKAFLDGGIDPNECYDESDYKGLQALIFPDATIECLRLLMPYVQLQEDDDGTYSPLRDALEQRLPSVVSLLLGSYGTSEDFSHKLNDCWTLIDLEEARSDELLELMTTAVARCKLVEEQEAFPELLDQIIEYCTDGEKIAYLGIFPSLLEPVIEKLREVKEDNSLNMAQSQLRTAFVLTHLEPELPRPTRSSIEPLPPDLVWKEKTDRTRYVQSQQLRSASSALIERATAQLRHAIDIDFFLKHRQAQEANMDMLSRIIESDLIDETGASTSLARLINNAWIQAAQYGVQWNVAPDSDKDANRFLLHTSRNLLRLQLEKFHSGLEIDNHYVEVLKKALSESSIPLRQFCTDPATWLRTLEHRNHLRPVDAAVLAIRLQIELGLSLYTARSIADAWHLAIEASRYGGGWATTAQLHQTIERSLAGTISEVMESDEAHTIVPASDRTMITAWCDIKRRYPHPARPPSTEVIGSGSSPDGARGRKRLADNQPDHLPPGKKHRLEHSVDDESSD